MKLLAWLRAGMEGTRPEDAVSPGKGQLSRLEREFLPPVLEIQETPPSSGKRMVLWSIVLLVAALLVWSYVGRIQVASMVAGKFIPDGKVKSIQALETSVVKAILVREGQEVRTGEMLLELDPTMNMADVDAARRHLENARERQKNAAPLLAIGAISRIEFLQIENEVADARSELTKASKRVELQSLRSPIDGVVQSVSVTTLGAVVTPAQSLVTIVPKGSSLTVEAMLSNDDIGFVKLGQPAEIKVDTFPFQKYGTIPGTLVWISPDAQDTTQKGGQAVGTPDSGSRPPDLNRDPAGTQYLYRVHIKPERTTMIIDGKDVALTAGMSVKADITTDQRRIVEFFLSPVIKYLDEGLKVR